MQIPVTYILSTYTAGIYAQVPWPILTVEDEFKDFAKWNCISAEEGVNDSVLYYLKPLKTSLLELFFIPAQALLFL